MQWQAVKTDLGLHCLPRHVCLKTEVHSFSPYGSLTIYEFQLVQGATFPVYQLAPSKFNLSPASGQLLTMKDFKNAKNENYYFLHPEHF